MLANNSTMRQQISVLAFSLGLTLLSVFVHWQAPSTMQQDEQIWSERLQYHHDDESFLLRPFTSNIVELGHDLIGWSYKTSFFVLQFLLAFIAGPVLYWYLRKLGMSDKQGLTGILVFYLSLPVLLAHFEPIYTWSDFWIYILVPLSLGALLVGHTITSMLLLTLALLSHEASFLLLPAWAFYSKALPNSSWGKVIAQAFGIIALFAIVRLIAFGPQTGHVMARLDLLLFNFDGWMRTRDTLFSLLMAHGAIWFLAARQLMISRNNTISHYDTLRISALVTSIGYVAVTLLFSQARETRLFFPPFVFLIPLTLIYCQSIWPSIQAQLRQIGTLKTWTVGIVVFALCALIATMLFPKFEFRAWQDGNRGYFTVHLFILITVWFLTRKTISAAPSSGTEQSLQQ